METRILPSWLIDLITGNLNDGTRLSMSAYFSEVCSEVVNKRVKLLLVIVTPFDNIYG